MHPNLPCPHPAPQYEQHIYVAAFTPLQVEKANTICILHTNSALARSAPNWFIDLRFTHLPDNFEDLLASTGLDFPSNLGIGRMFPREYQRLNCSEMNEVLHRAPKPGYDTIFNNWLEHWRRELTGKRAALYTRNFFFFLLFKELGLKHLPFFAEIHRLSYWKYVDLDPKTAALDLIKRRLGEERSIQFDLIGQAEKIFCISETIEKKLKLERPDLNTVTLRSGFEMSSDVGDLSLCDENRDIDLLYTGQLYDWKGVHIIIEALRYCSPRVKLTIVGGRVPADRAAQMQIAEHWGVADRINWVGQVAQSEVAAYQRRAKLGLIPLDGRFHISKWFTSPIKVFEMMATGTPLLAADVPTLRCFLKEGVTAEFASLNTPRSWGAKIDALLADPNHRYRMAQNALKFVSDFSYEKRGARIRDEIEEYFHEHPAARGVVQ